MLASALGSGFSAAPAQISTLAERDKLIQESFLKSPEDALKSINEAQQEEKIKVDDQHYVVVIKKEGDKYVRVAHFKKDKLNQAVEQSIMSVMQEAETKLAGGSGPVSFSFSAGEKKLFAALSKQSDFLVFNICPTQDEVEGLLKAHVKPEEKKEEVKVIVADKPADAPVAPAAPAADASEKPADKPVDTTAPVATPAPSADVSAPAPEKTTDVVPAKVELADAKPATVTDSAKKPEAAAAA